MVHALWGSTVDPANAAAAQVMLRSLLTSLTALQWLQRTSLLWAGSSMPTCIVHTAVALACSVRVNAIGGRTADNASRNRSPEYGWHGLLMHASYATSYTLVSARVKWRNHQAATCNATLGHLRLLDLPMPRRIHVMTNLACPVTCAIIEGRAGITQLNDQMTMDTQDRAAENLRRCRRCRRCHLHTSRLATMLNAA